jgi:hypothetical protein
MSGNPKLVEDYRAGWAQYDLSLRELQRAADQGDHGSLEPLLLSVERAQLNYSAARDRLAAEMLGADIGALASAVADRRIHDTAQLLWELSGKPQGTAENDWLRAERIVRHASAATA